MMDSLRTAMKRAERTQTGDVEPLLDWNSMAATIRKARNYLVTVQAEQARHAQTVEDVTQKLKEEGEEIDARMTDAKDLLFDAESRMKAAMRDALGVNV